MAVKRADRIAAEVQRAIADIIRNDVHDPRVGALCSVLRVELSSDLAYCRAYVSVYGTKEEQQQAYAALEKAAPFVRHCLGTKVRMRKVPEIRFIPDDSIEYSVHISQILDSINAKKEEEEG